MVLVGGLVLSTSSTGRIAGKWKSDCNVREGRPMLREVLPILNMATLARREGKGGEKEKRHIGRPWQLDFNSRTVSCRGLKLQLLSI